MHVIVVPVSTPLPLGGSLFLRASKLLYVQHLGLSRARAPVDDVLAVYQGLLPTGPSSLFDLEKGARSLISFLFFVL